MNAEKTDNCIISVEGLEKRFGDVPAVNGLSFNVREGEIFGFLGPNGAGKTTTINMLTGLARPDAGNVNVAGMNCSRNAKAAQRLMGIVPDESNLWPELNGFENLSFCGSLYGMRRRDREKRARELLETVGLTDAGQRRFGGYSKGMKRKLTIAAAIVHRPRILFLDEPTTGIDVASARQIRQLLRKLNKSGTTIFLTTHYIEEAERLCDRVAFIVEGKIVRIDTLENLVRNVQGQRIVQLALDCPSGESAELLGPLRDLFTETEFETVGNAGLRAITREAMPLAPLVRFLEERGVAVTEAKVVRPSLEEVFVKITGIALERMRKEKELEKAKGGKQ
jgi:ABC-2 type transport system ATP-binding protein